jgi:peptidoglycan/LPS O-acetylase OafA/YrhL
MIIVGLQGTGGLLSNVLGCRPFVFLSTISYNLYIWHGILFQEMLDRNIPIQRTADVHQDSIWQFRYFWSCLFASLVVSTAVTYLFEKPIMKRFSR